MDILTSLHSNRIGLAADGSLVLDGRVIAQGAAAQPAAIASLTNNSGGTANDTVEVIPAAVAATTDTTAASLASTNAALTAVKNDIADLTVKVNAVLAALRTAGTIKT